MNRRSFLRLFGLMPIAALASSIPIRKNAPVEDSVRSKYLNAPLWVPGMEVPQTGEVRRVWDGDREHRWDPAVYNGDDNDPAFYVL